MLPASLIILVTRRLAIILVRRVSPWRRSSPNAVPTLGWRQLVRQRFPVLSIPDAATALILPLVVLLNVDQVFVPVPLAARALRRSALTQPPSWSTALRVAPAALQH